MRKGDPGVAFFHLCSPLEVLSGPARAAAMSPTRQLYQKPGLYRFTLICAQDGLDDVGGGAAVLEVQHLYLPPLAVTGVTGDLFWFVASP